MKTAKKNNLKSVAIIIVALLLINAVGSSFFHRFDLTNDQRYTLSTTSLNIIEPTTAKIIDSESFMELLSKHKIAFFGDGALKCKDVIAHPNAIFLADIHPLASGMIDLGIEAFKEAKFEDVAYFEPFYLKDFVATKPKNKFF